MKTTTIAILATSLSVLGAGCASHRAEPVAVAPAPPAVVTTTPGTSAVVVASPATNGVATRITGRVTDVESTGEIDLKATDGKSMKLRVPATTAAGVQKGDQATIDVTFSR